VGGKAIVILKEETEETVGMDHVKFVMEEVKPLVISVRGCSKMKVSL
jgi:hypothetical protein